MEVSTIINTINVGLLGALLIIYVKIFQKSKASFAIGLILFSIMLMIHNLISVYAYVMMASFYSDELMPFLLGVNLAELAGIAILLKITL